jgi:taurine---2-oxoglutarate transaminase
VPFNAAGADAKPVAQLTKAALDAGLYLFVHWNVIMLAPPLNITREELDEGLSILDDALAVADEYAA